MPVKLDTPPLLLCAQSIFRVKTTQGLVRIQFPSSTRMEVRSSQYLKVRLGETTFNWNVEKFRWQRGRDRALWFREIGGLISSVELTLQTTSRVVAAVAEEGSRILGPEILAWVKQPEQMAFLHTFYLHENQSRLVDLRLEWDKREKRINQLQRRQQETQAEISKIERGVYKQGSSK